MMKQILCVAVVLMAMCAPVLAYHKAGVTYYDLAPSKSGEFELPAEPTEAADPTYSSTPLSMHTISPINTGAAVASVPRANMLASFPSNTRAAAAAAAPPKAPAKPAAPSAGHASSTASATGTGTARIGTGSAGFNHGKAGGKLPTNLQFMFF